MSLKATDFTADVTLTPEQVKEACKQYVERELREMQVTPVEAYLNCDTKGGDSPGCPTPILRNVVVKVKQKEPTKPKDPRLAAR